MSEATEDQGAQPTHEEVKTRGIQLLRMLAMGRPGAGNELAELLFPDPDSGHAAAPLIDDLVEAVLARLPRVPTVEEIADAVLARLQAVPAAGAGSAAPADVVEKAAEPGRRGRPPKAKA